MLTLESILKTTRQAASYNEHGRHHFGQSSVPVHASHGLGSNLEGPKPGQVRVWDEEQKMFVWKERP